MLTTSPSHAPYIPDPKLTHQPPNRISLFIFATIPPSHPVPNLFLSLPLPGALTLTPSNTSQPNNKHPTIQHKPHNLVLNLHAHPLNPKPNLDLHPLQRRQKPTTSAAIARLPLERQGQRPSSRKHRFPYSMGQSSCRGLMYSCTRAMDVRSVGAMASKTL